MIGTMYLRMGAFSDAFLTGQAQVLYRYWNEEMRSFYEPGSIVDCVGHKGHPTISARILEIKAVELQEGRAVIDPEDWDKAGFAYLAFVDIQRALALWLLLDGRPPSEGFVLYRVALQPVEVLAAGTLRIAELKTTRPGWPDLRKSLAEAIQEVSSVN